MAKERSSVKLKLEEEEKLIEEFESKKTKLDNIKLKREIKHFHFMDFAQIVIGVGAFGLPAIINTSFWDYIPNVDLSDMIFIHLFFLFCVIIATNYQFRKDLPFGDNWFMIMLTKRIFYTYVSVFMAITALMVLVGELNMQMTMYEYLLNTIAAQNVGLVGAVTFSFFKKGA